MEESSLTSVERLQRQGQASTGGIANLIVIGTSAGGHLALLEIFKDLSADMPAAIVLLLHMPLSSPSSLKDSLGRFSQLPMTSRFCLQFQKKMLADLNIFMIKSR